MVNNISWGSYWSVLIVLTLIYYSCVLLVYYRSGLVKLFQPASSLKEKPGHSENSDEELLPVVQSLTDETMAYLEQAGKCNAVKQEIIFALRRITKKYQPVKNSAYQDAVNSLLKFECENKCAIHLSEEEINHVWMV